MLAVTLPMAWCWFLLVLYLWSLILPSVDQEGARRGDAAQPSLLQGEWRSYWNSLGEVVFHVRTWSRREGHRRGWCRGGPALALRPDPTKWISFSKVSWRAGHLLPSRRERRPCIYGLGSPNVYVLISHYVRTWKKNKNNNNNNRESR